MKVKRKATPTYLLRPVKIFQDYQIVDLPKDIMAGITVAIILLPQAIAFTLIAELPPQMGLYAAIVAAIFGALWGSSNQMQTGPANTTSLLILSVLLTIAEPGSPKYVAAAGLLAVMVGVFCLVMGLARLGILVNFISDSLIVGFTSGAGILIMVSQLRNLLRLDFPSSPSILVTLRNVSLHFQDIHMPSLILGVGTIAVVILLKKISPKAPGLFMGIIASALAVVYFGLEQQGVSVIGQLPRGLPPLAQLPLFDWDLIRELSNGALAVS
ncbi:MAG: SulP family inorganic anion transporter, partial [Anaerolineae bacterium]|nr:SulP family inorganic anion transporter [Anaerolineae bacterium]